MCGRVPLVAAIDSSALCMCVQTVVSTVPASTPGIVAFHHMASDHKRCACVTVRVCDCV